MVAGRWIALVDFPPPQTKPGQEMLRSLSRYGLRDDRRRRLLAEELSNVDAWPAGRADTEDAMSRPTTKTEQNVSDGDVGLRVVDFLPRRWLAIGVAMATGAAIILSLEVAYGWMLDRAADGAKIATTLQVDAKGSLACWFSSLVLLAAALVTLVIYGIRRRRADDYQGRYRVWLWAAGLWFLMATDTAASLGEAFGEAMVALTGATLGANGAPWWMTAYLIVGAAVGARLLREMRGCRLSITALAAAVVSYSLALAMEFGWIPTEGVRTITFRTAATMAGHGLILAAMVLQARHAILVAKGVLPERKPSLQIVAEPEDATEKQPAGGESKPAPASDRRWLKIDPPHAAPPSASVRPATAATTAAASNAAVATSPADHKLSKAERKALKERLLRERRERERR